MRNLIYLLLFVASFAVADIDLLPFIVKDPEYPASAKAKKIEGYVVVQLDIGSDGFPENIKVIESYPEEIFDDAALEAAKKLRYVPRHIDGKFITVPNVLYKFSFRL